LSAAGTIYLLVNPSLPNIVKIGKTTRTASERAIELSLATGVPTPFTVVYEAKFSNCHIAEQMVHELLETQGYRTASNREFFSIAPTVGINAIITIQGLFKDVSEESSNGVPDESEFDTAPWEQFEDKAREYHYGSDLVMENVPAAINAYKTAIKLGSKKGYSELADVYFGNKLDNDGFSVLMNGAESNVPRCWLELALIYIGENIYTATRYVNKENAIRCFRNFFQAVNPDA
jgi:hypothetical protein